MGAVSHTHSHSSGVCDISLQMVHVKRGKRATSLRRGACPSLMERLFEPVEMSVIKLRLTAFQGQSVAIAVSRGHPVIEGC